MGVWVELNIGTPHAAVDAADLGLVTPGFAPRTLKSSAHYGNWPSAAAFAGPPDHKGSPGSSDSSRNGGVREVPRPLGLSHSSPGY